VVRLIAARSGKDIGPARIVNVNGHHTAVELAPEERHPCLQPDVAKLKLLNAPVVRALASQFAMDFVQFGYLPGEEGSVRGLCTRAGAAVATARVGTA